MSETILLKELPYTGSAVDLLEIVQEEPHAFLLESSRRHARMGRFSFIGFDPVAVWKNPQENTLEILRHRFQSVQMRRRALPTPFPAGLMGYLSYDFGLGLEDSVSRRRRADIPGFLCGVYDAIITVDHARRKIYVTSTGLPEENPARRLKKARQRLQEIIRRIENVSHSRRAKAKIPAAAAGTSLRLQSNFTKTEYTRAVRKALDYIRRGDIYQANLSQRFSARTKTRVNPVGLYKSLRALSPACFGGYFDTGDFQIVSSSPERFLSLRGPKVETRPMKGTRPRGTDRSSDERYRGDLWMSRKDKAELLMITDLERNDLGRVCAYGSVRVKEMRVVEAYRTVFQATSTVEGRLREDKDCFDLLAACFPGGSITGCPKIRAMEIIDELEPSARGIYTGSLGYINCFGDMDLNIMIRTLLVQGRMVSFSAGGGIVADSTPAGEYKETLVKARAMRECLAGM